MLEEKKKENRRFGEKAALKKRGAIERHKEQWTESKEVDRKKEGTGGEGSACVCPEGQKALGARQEFCSSAQLRPPAPYILRCCLALPPISGSGVLNQAGPSIIVNSDHSCPRRAR